MKPIHPKGRISEVFAGARYRVEMDTGEEIIAYMTGKMKMRHISLMVGDRVEVILDPLGGHATNRIVWRV
jgi:translation initiation factor IF-1